MTSNKSSLWSFFSSVKLTIFLLAVIAVFSAIGTVIPQREAAVEFSRQLSPEFNSFLQKMQLFDLYHSIWFFLMMAFLALNLIVCSLARIPMAWRRFRQQPSPQDKTVFQDLPDEQIFRTKQDPQAVVRIASEIMKSKLGNLQRVDEAEGTTLCGRKGGFVNFGVYIVHLSMLLLISGAVIGSIFGIEGNVNINEGETVNVINLKNGNETMKLPFAVRCDKFIVELYENGAPKMYRSDLSFIRDGKVALQGQLLVNHPLSFEGIRFYQASYGLASEGKASLFLFKNGMKIQEVNVGLGNTFALPGGEGQVRVLRIEENLMKMGPAVKLSVHSAKGEVSFWVFQHLDKIKEMNPDVIAQVPMLNPGFFRPYTFVLTGLQEKYYTGLQVSRDPGIPLVVLAALFMTIGLIIVLLFYSRQIWMRIDVAGGRTIISIAGRSHKNAIRLSNEIQHLLLDLRGRLEKF